MLIVALMVLSTVLAVVISAAPTAAAAPAGATAAPVAAPVSVAPPQASGSITSYLSTFVVGTSTSVAVTDVFSGGTFGSGATIGIFVSSSTTFTSSSISLGSYTLAAGTTTLSNAHILLTWPSLAATPPSPTGSVYLAAGSPSSSPTSFSAPVAVTAVAEANTPEITIPSISLPGSAAPGTTVAVTATGFDPGASVSVYFSQGDGTAFNAQLLTTFTTSSTGGSPPSAAFTMPDSAGGAHSIFAQETNALSPTFVIGGVSADTSITTTAAITVTPFVFNGAKGTTLTVAGEGFEAGATIAANSIEVAGTAGTNSATTVSSGGAFSAAVTTTAAIAAPGGAVTIKITTSPASSPTSFPDAAWVSTPNPGELEFAFTVAVSVTPGAAVTGVAWNFPSGATVTFLLGSVVMGTVTADSLGYAALPATATLPAIPAGTYPAVAADLSAGLYSTSTSTTVVTSMFTMDPAGFTLTTSESSTTAEYVPSGGTLTLFAYAQTPGAQYLICDSVYGSTSTCAEDSIGVAFNNGLATISVPVGTFDAVTGNFLPASNGTLIINYAPDYASVPVTTITAAEIGFTSFASANLIAAYNTIGVPGMPADWGTFGAGATSGTVTVGGLIKNTATFLYPGVSFDYSLYLGTSLLTLTAGTATVCNAAGSACSTSSGTISVTFTVPTATGVQDLAVVYAGASVSAALNSAPMVVSSAGSAASSGTIMVVTDPISGDTMVVGFDLLPAATTYSLNVSTSTGVKFPTVSVSSYGALTAVDLTAAGYTAEPAGTYSVILFVASPTGTSASLLTSYTVGAVLVIPPADSSGPIGTTFPAAAAGLAVGGFYDVYFAGSFVYTVGPASSTGTLSISVTVPTIADGTYNLAIAPTGTTTFVATAAFTVTSTTEFTLTSGGTDASTAFPTELVSFAWTPATAPSSGAPVEVTALLNGTAFTTEPAAFDAASGVLSGSFEMPNAPAGTYFGLSLEWTQTVVTSGASATTTYTSATSAFLQLVSGNGAFLTGISPGQIAEITDSINSTLTVPLAELHASVESINNATAKIITAFGTMTATLSSINATLTKVAGTVATIETSIGTITTSLSTISAQITSVNGVVTSMNTTLNVVAGNVVSIQTSVGTINGKVTSVLNGIATVQTSLGNLSVAVSKIPTSPASASDVNTAVYLLYAAIALIVVTLALAAVLLVRSGGRGGQGGHPAKAYEGPSSSTPPSSGGSGGGSTGGA